MFFLVGSVADSLNLLLDDSSSILSFACAFLIVFEVLLAGFKVLAWPPFFKIQPFSRAFEVCIVGQSLVSLSTSLMRSGICSLLFNFNMTDPSHAVDVARFLCRVIEVLILLLVNAIAKNIPD